MRVILLTISMISFAVGIFAQKIMLPNGLLTFSDPASKVLQPDFNKQVAFDNKYYFAVSFSTLPGKASLDGLSKAGIRILERLAPQIYLIESEMVPQAIPFGDAGITGVSIITSILKIDTRLQTGMLPQYAQSGKGHAKVMVGIYGNADRSLVEKGLQETGFQPTRAPWAKAGVYEGIISLEKLSALGQLPFVYAIQPVSPEDQKLNGIGRGSSGSALLNAPIAQGGRGLLGEGIAVGVGDDSDPTLHPDIRDRVISHTPGFPNNHGAHTSGTVAGAGILSPSRAGFAPKATVISQWFSGVWKNAPAYTQAHNMVVTNNSYGSIVGDCIYAGVYDLTSRLLDQQAFEFPQLLHAFASGNDGDNTCAPFPRAYGTVLGGYQSAKNILTVGRTDYTQITSSSSSSGPVKDGRLKPEITGLGIINSLNGAGTGYFTEFGTSMSAPNITGGLALLYERYRQFSGGINPHGALMKALLLNGARDVGTKGPDYRHGYGTMMLERSLRMLENKQYTVRTLTQGAIQDTIIQIQPGTSQLKIMLYWHDPAANVLATQTLVHDLDLEVITPTNQTILPKILNPAADQVTQSATEGADHTNNHEQVMIDNPVPGAYTIRVKGTEVITMPQQPYAVAFDMVPAEIRFTNPVKAGVVAGANTHFPIAWEDEGSPEGSYTLSYSLNNGNTWTNIIENLKDTTRLFQWQPGSIRSTQARLRLQKGSTLVETENFAIIPNVAFSVADANDQCFTFFRINWTALTPQEGETIEYTVKMKAGAEMQTIATVAGQNFFVIKNLNPDSLYYAAVVAKINGVEGTYNLAINRRPNNGNCLGAVSNGDLMLDSIVAPLSGRQFTATQLSPNTPLIVRVRNLDDVASGAYTLKYSINGAPFVESVVNTPIALRNTALFTFNNVDLSAPGDYQITAIVVHNGATDPNAANDTFRTVIRHLPNTPLNLAAPFTDNFESLQKITRLLPQKGLAGGPRWDYVNQDPLARVRTEAFPGNARSGEKAITLDVSKAPPRVTNPFNRLEGTFNLSQYQTQNDAVRLSFFYKAHGVLQEAHALNKVWVRGSDQDDWVELVALGSGANGMSGLWQPVAGLNLSKALSDAGQQFSSSTQIRFGQYGLYSMADNENFAGYSFDDVSLLLAENDIRLLDITSPVPENCGTGAQMQVTARVVNNMPEAVHDIEVRYRVNGGTWVNDNINSIGGYDTISFAFSTPIILNGSGIFNIEAEVLKNGDNIPENNAAKATTIVQPVVQGYPFFEDFEDDDGHFLSNGINNTWAYGTPASVRINGAASGTKAWKTRLIGNYNDLEQSYLYTPCFNISGLTKPMLSFSLAYQMEDCRNFNAVCDAVWMEYSLDGGAWTKLGSYGDGVNWYDYANANVWMAADATTWRDALIALPIHNGNIRLRYALFSDLGSNREGMAIDNFQIYNGDALPLEWLSFTAKLQAVEEVTLQWRVANRKPGERFILEVARGTENTQAFEAFGTVEVKENDQQPYHFTHRVGEKPGIWLYRAAWYRQNGEISYSPVRKIETPGAKRNLLVYPNPATSELRVLTQTLSDHEVTIRIMTMNGRAIHEQRTLPSGNILNAKISLSSLALPAGMYLLEIVDGNEKRVKKWVKR
jgi:hypothetical protein